MRFQTSKLLLSETDRFYFDVVVIIAASQIDTFTKLVYGNNVCHKFDPNPQPGRSMTRDSKINKRLVALFLFGFALLNYPLLSLFKPEVLIFGLPLLYVYVFGVWCLLIGLTALVTVYRSKERPDDSDTSGG